MIRHPLRTSPRRESANPRPDSRSRSARCPRRRDRRDRRPCAAPPERNRSPGPPPPAEIGRVALVALALPTRRPFDTPDQIDDRIRRADTAFAMAYELGTKVVLVRAGAVPPKTNQLDARPLSTALRELGVPGRAPRCPVRDRNRLGAGRAAPGVSRDNQPPRPRGQHRSGRGLETGMDPIASVRELAAWIVHAYANDAVHSPSSAVPTRAGSDFRPAPWTGKNTSALWKRSAIAAS